MARTTGRGDGQIVWQKKITRPEEHPFDGQWYFFSILDLMAKFCSDRPSEAEEIETWL